MKSARLTMMLEPEDKQRIETRARGLGVSTGEFVRRASQSYEPDIDPETLDRLVVEFEANTRAMRETLRAANDYAEARLAEVAALREAHHGRR
ncbi:hypothetical protein KX816_20610 [Sphingosinicellaceae bacterium]|nr:hypothetical protein KX816_20610 [Sphingosinicellaceae bacterium]